MGIYPWRLANKSLGYSVYSSPTSLPPMLKPKLNLMFVVKLKNSCRICMQLFHNISLFYYLKHSNNLPLNGLTFHEATPSHLMDEYVLLGYYPKRRLYFLWFEEHSLKQVWPIILETHLSSHFIFSCHQERFLVDEQQSYNSMQRRSFCQWWCAWLYPHCPLAGS